MVCSNCGSSNLESRGTRQKKTGVRKQYLCKDCGKWSSVVINRHRTARIALVDIETAYMEIKGIWSLKHNDYIAPSNIVKDWSILCWAGKWLFEEEVMGEVVTPEEAINRDSKSILDSLWKMLDEADIIITFNGKSFDIPRINTQFLINGYKRPSFYQHIDLYKIITGKDGFEFSSNGLDFLGRKLLGLEGKKKMSMPDWDACVSGDKKALQKMLEYCKVDVAPLLEDLYLFVLPWILNHPNLGVYNINLDKDICPNCEGQNINWNYIYTTPQGLFQAWRCNDCGSMGRGKGKRAKIKSVSLT